MENNERQNEEVGSTNVRTTTELFQTGGRQDENPTRGYWSRRAEFVLTLLGYTMGLPTIWSFPYLCYKNGGGAFLIPYTIATIFVGLPMLFMELSLGQFSSQGCITVWNCCPLFKGIGYSNIIIVSLLAIYQNVLVAYSLLYFSVSFAALPGVPWRGCDHVWNTADCYNGSREMSGAYEYLTHYVLKESDSIEETGSIRWHLALCLMTAWGLTFFALILGVKSLGKVVYVVVPLIYAILVFLLVRGVTLPGALDGIMFYITPDFSLLTKVEVWMDAVSMALLSMNVGYGGLHVLASYNRFHTNFFAEALVIPIVNYLTNVLAGFTVFAFLGFLAHELFVPVGEVTRGGTSLAFISMPSVMTRLPLSPLWSAVFFLMLILLGLTFQFVITQTVVTSLYDEFAILRRLLKQYTWIFTGVICTVFFLMGILLVTESGRYWLVLLDVYTWTFALVPVVLVKLFVVICMYGYRRFSADVRVMFRASSIFFWLPVISISVYPMLYTPVLLSFLLVRSYMDYQPLSYGYWHSYPRWADPVLAWMIVTVCICPIFVYMFYQVVAKEKGSIRQRLYRSIKPTKTWGPMLERHRQEAGYPPIAGVALDNEGFSLQERA